MPYDSASTNTQECICVPRQTDAIDFCCVFIQHSLADFLIRESLCFLCGKKWSLKDYLQNFMIKIIFSPANAITKFTPNAQLLPTAAFYRTASLTDTLPCCQPVFNRMMTRNQQNVSPPSPTPLLVINALTLPSPRILSIIFIVLVTFYLHHDFIV